MMRAFEVDFMDFNFLTFPQFTTKAGAFAAWAKGAPRLGSGQRVARLSRSSSTSSPPQA